MSEANWERRVGRLEETKLPKPRPDMTHWTTQERVLWEAEQNGLQAMVRAANDSDAPDVPEEADARDARDEAILAERAALAAADAWKRDPTSLRLERRAREAREAADKAKAAADVARRAAEEAARRPRPPAPVAAPQAMPEPAAPPPKPEAEAKPKRRRKRREPGQPKPEKLWWEEKAKWVSRGSPDYDWQGGVRYECIHEYDPLDAEEDYDPFGE